MSNFHREDELIDIIRKIARQEVGDIRSFRFGTIKEYDPTANTVRVIFPIERNFDGEPMESPMIQLLSPWCGAFSGMQIYPVGGEQVLVASVERKFGASAALAFMFNLVAPPPNQALADDDKLLPGELILRHAIGTILRFKANGDIKISTMDQTEANIILDSDANVNIKAKANVDISANEDIKLKAEGKLSVETSQIDVDAGDKKLTVNIKAKEDVEVNASKLTATVNCQNSNVNATRDIVLHGNMIDIHADDTLKIEAGRMVLSGDNIFIGNENNSTARTNSIRIDSNLTQTIGRIRNKVIGTKISIGSLDRDDAFHAHRIDLYANRGS